MKIKTILLTSAMSFAVATAAQAAPVTFGADLLDDATSVTQDGLTMTATTSNGGFVGTYTDDGNGLYIGGGYQGATNALSGSYSLGFDQKIDSISISYDWLTDNASGVENIFNFATDASGAVTITHAEIGSTGQTSYDGTTVVSNTRRGDGVISYSGAGFNAFLFDHTQASATLGFVIRDITVNIAPVPLPAGLPLLLVGLGAFAMVRRKKA